MGRDYNGVPGAGFNQSIYPEPPITSLTDSSGGTASTTIAAQAGYATLTFPHTFESGTSAGEAVTAYTIGYPFEIISWGFVTDVPGVGASASRVFNMEIGTTDVGTVASTVTLTEASTSAKGEGTAGTTVTGANTGTATDTFSIEVAAGGTQFTAGSGAFYVRVRNTASSAALSQVVSTVNEIIVAMRNNEQIRTA
jgi:hypothetical protein